MQIRQSQVKGDRPTCVHDPKHSVHYHGRYSRRKNPDGDEQIVVVCWICSVCGAFYSVLPADALPYRPMSATMLESGLESAFNDEAPQPGTENEKGCIKRATKSFCSNIPFLTNVLGQIVETTCPSAAQLWQELKRLGDMQAILRFLAEHFNTSLLKDYKCLKPRMAQ